MPMNILHFWDSAVKYSTNEHSEFLRFCCEIFYRRICTFCYKIYAEGHFALLKKSVEGYFMENRPKWLLTITFGDFKKWVCLEEGKRLSIDVCPYSYRVFSLRFTTFFLSFSLFFLLLVAYYSLVVGCFSPFCIFPFESPFP